MTATTNFAISRNVEMCIRDRGQFIEIDDPIVGIFVYEEPHHMRADESGAAGNEDVAFHVFAFSVFISRCSG